MKNGRPFHYRSCKSHIGGKCTCEEVRGAVEEQMFSIHTSEVVMTYKVQDVVLETEKYFAIRVDKGFEVYRKGSTAATRCAVIGYQGQQGLDRCKQEIDRRQAAQ